MEEEDEVGKEKGGDKESPKISNQTLEENPKQKMNNKAKSCKGCLLYSSTLNSNSGNPLCLGILRSLPQVPRHIVGESEVDVSREGRSLAEFKYACVGYSVYSNGKDPTADVQETQAELPVCVGLEVLYDKRVNAADSVPAHVHSREAEREERKEGELGRREERKKKFASNSNNPQMLVDFLSLEYKNLLTL
ncbi:hypothetical protein LOK49_LG04G01195 [Camellia lanceoleosa]|uniref:Uncharacterized protein n=1 Tax=Camellia lanceoleosa TaxID=1840588 RepID=A0ACC0HWX7_9ERIC|nr:hypothetical protein LOK49_LG04G01195 [Camellia lanceoleosa]